ncbi:MAG TPA: VOC family protein [Saprospiraceae bacterium]|nr:VOC family protein [Saprospiraceae bacterium]
MKITSIAILSIALLTLLALFPSCGEKNAPPAGVLQIGLVCSNLDKSLDFYKNIVGMTETGGFEVDGQFGTDSGLSDGKPFKVRMLKLEDTPHATTLKLACCSDSAGIKPNFVTDAPGVRYITFEVPSTKAVKERFSKNGIRLLGKCPVSMGDNQELILVQDPDGVFVEIIGGKE